MGYRIAGACDIQNLDISFGRDVLTVVVVSLRATGVSQKQPYKTGVPLNSNSENQRNINLSHCDRTSESIHTVGKADAFLRGIIRIVLPKLFEKERNII